MSTVCLGCGSSCEAPEKCERCHALLVKCLDVYGHWPLETSITAATLLHVETAIREYLHTSASSVGDTERNELYNTANTIRAFLQSAVRERHVPAAKDKEDTAWLD